MAFLSLQQCIVLAVLIFISSTLSIVGSFAIIRSVQRQLRLPPDTGGKSRRNLGQRQVCTENRTYLRLLLGMSCFDIIASLNMMAQPFMTDVESQFPIAFGNRSTCTMTGCFMQIGFAGFIYYGMLSYFYLFSVRLGYTKGWIARRAEPIMHAFAIVWPVVTAVVGVFVDWYSYNDIALGCWVANYPKGCQFEVPMTCDSTTIGWTIAGGVYVFLVLSLAVNNTLVYVHVKRVYGKTSKKTTENQSEKRFFPQLQRLFARGADDAEGTASFRESGTRTSGDPASPGQQDSVHPPTVDSRALFARSFNDGEAQKRRIRQVATQATLYVIAALLAYVPSIIQSLLVQAGYTNEYQSDVYGFMLVHTVLFPLSGFWNAVIYFRPQYLAARRRRAESHRNMPGSRSILWSNRSGGDVEGSSRGFWGSSRWRLRSSPSKDDAKANASGREFPTPTRRASSFLALDTTYMNEPGISSITAAMLEAANMLDAEEDDEKSLFSHVKEKEEDGAVCPVLNGDSSLVEENRVERDEALDCDDELLPSCDDESKASTTACSQGNPPLGDDVVFAIPIELMPTERCGEDMENRADTLGPEV